MRYALTKADGAAISTSNYHLIGIAGREVLGNDAWDQFYKFAFVRNPWARLVSWYNMRHNPIPTGRLPHFAAFLDRAPVWRNQVEWVADGGEQIVDFVGRFETLQRDFDYVCERVGVTPDLVKMNQSKQVDYHDFYTPEIRDLVAERCSRDIEAFGYQF